MNFVIVWHILLWQLAHSLVLCQYAVSRCCAGCNLQNVSQSCNCRQHAHLYYFNLFLRLWTIISGAHSSRSGPSKFILISQWHYSFISVIYDDGPKWQKRVAMLTKGRGAIKTRACCVLFWMGVKHGLSCGGCSREVLGTITGDWRRLRNEGDSCFVLFIRC